MNEIKIKKIKIFGERNSGTNFLEQLIQKNVKNIELYSSYYKGGSGWKHGYPKLNLFKHKQDNTLFIFIIRDLENWLNSMYKRPYHIKKGNNIDTFLTDKIKPNDKRKDHDINIVNEEINLTIFELRYKKIKSYLDAFSHINNGMIINLEDLQLDYGKNFIVKLNSEFKLPITSKFIYILKHTKTNKKEQNEKISIKLNSKIINNRKDSKIESFVNGLKKSFFIKSSV